MRLDIAISSDYCYKDYFGAIGKYHDMGWKEKKEEERNSHNGFFHRDGIGI